ncbi:MAG: ribosome maturation factor RimM [Paracoccaceae bacterium]
MTQLICVGAIAGSFGVNGEVRLKSFCADPAAISDYGALCTQDGSLSFDVKILRPVKNGFATRLTGVETKEQADALRGTKLFAQRETLPSLPDDEYYHTDLMGLAVLDTGGIALGIVKAVQNHGAGDLLEVQTPHSSATVLVPFTQATVPTVDLTAGRIIIDPADGLFPK